MQLKKVQKKWVKYEKKVGEKNTVSLPTKKQLRQGKIPQSWLKEHGRKVFLKSEKL